MYQHATRQNSHAAIKRETMCRAPAKHKLENYKTNTVSLQKQKAIKKTSWYDVYGNDVRSFTSLCNALPTPYRAGTRMRSAACSAPQQQVRVASHSRSASLNEARRLKAGATPEFCSHRVPRSHICMSYGQST